MAEEGSTAENPKIPEHWNFPERNKPGLKVSQIDLQEEFLAFSLTDEGKGEFPKSDVQYFFKKGEPVARKFDQILHTDIRTSIKQMLQDSESAYSIIRDQEEISLEGYFPYRNEILDDSSFPPDSLAAFRFYQDIPYIYDARLGHIFGYAQDGKVIEKTPLEGYLVFQRRNSGERTEDWTVEAHTPTGYVRFRGEDLSMPYILDKDTEMEQKLHWAVSENETSSGNKEKILVINATHVSSGIIKTLRIPLQLYHKDKILEAIQSKHPYSKDETGRLVVPWRNIDRVVGASLSYSYPPQTPQK